MLIKTKPVSAALQKSITESLQSEGHARFLTEAAGGAPNADVTLSFPHETYFMPLDAVAEGRSLDAASQTGTRVLLSDARQHVYAAAEIGQQEQGPQAAQYDNSPFLQPMLEGLSRLAASDYQRQYHDLDPRLLRIPALYIMAIWLHSDAGPVNLVMPIGLTPAPLEANRVYTAEEFLGEIRGLASERLEQDRRSPLGAPGGTK